MGPRGGPWMLEKVAKIFQISMKITIFQQIFLIFAKLFPFKTEIFYFSNTFEFLR